MSELKLPNNQFFSMSEFLEHHPAQCEKMIKNMRISRTSYWALLLRSKLVEIKICKDDKKA